jgi:methionyl-tRNA formyltransferase
MKVLYAGSPEAAKKTLEILVENQEKYGFEIVGVLSNPPSAKGRHKELTPTPVAAYAAQKNIPVFTPEHLDAQAREQIVPLNADLLFCFAYGHIFGPKFLALFPLGGVNLHPSMLPKYRGCTPVPAAILNRDKQTAITIQTLGLKMDEGDILAQKIVDLDFSETGESLLNFAAEEGAQLFFEVVEKTNQNIQNGKNELPQGKKQEGEPSYTKIILKEDGKIDWNLPVEVIEAKVRAYFSEPGCFTFEKLSETNVQSIRILNGKMILNEEIVSKYKDEPNGKVVDFVKNDGIYIKCSNGIYCVTLLQRQGKKEMNHKDFMNGARNFVGSQLGM